MIYGVRVWGQIGVTRKKINLQIVLSEIMNGHRISKSNMVK
jgi:hypothetical protein